MTIGRRSASVLVSFATVLLWSAGIVAAPPENGLVEVRIPSSADQSAQPAMVWAPAGQDAQPRPLLVFLHSWSGNWKQDNTPWLEQARQRGWIYLHPDFRGRNDHPEACGSKIARQDLLDSIDWAVRKHRVDPSRIYLAGVSGGGHMAMLMAARHPERFSAVTSWVGISDLADWHKFHTKDGQPRQYATMTAASCGGPPGASETVDDEYRDRSPIHWLQQVGDLPLDINAGVHDGKTGSVPVSQSLRAFNVVARAGGHPVVSDAEMAELWRNDRLSNPGPQDVAAGGTYGRALHLRRTAGATRVTIFEGGHEGLPDAACKWLEQQARQTQSTTNTRRGGSQE